ncbi:hypothetical protein Tco_1213465 [Tanacetum coccineum]
MAKTRFGSASGSLEKRPDMDGVQTLEHLGFIAKLAYMDYGFSKWDVRTASSMDISMKRLLDPTLESALPMKVLGMQNVPYASAVGSIMYAVRCTRPDVAFAQNITSRFQQNPGDLHWTTVKNILKYLRNTKDMFLVYGGAVDWKSAKQSIFATSSAEAEYIAAFNASKEAVWVRKFISGLGVVPDISCQSSLPPRSYLNLMNKVRKEKVHTDDNLDDPFTKALAFPKHSELTRNIRMLPTSSFM